MSERNVATTSRAPLPCKRDGGAARGDESAKAIEGGVAQDFGQVGHLVRKTLLLPLLKSAQDRSARQDQQESGIEA